MRQVRIFVLILSLLAVNRVFGQEIPEIGVAFVPAHPKATDSVQVISKFPLSGCSELRYEIEVQVDWISIKGIDCGFESDGCTGVDTLDLGVLDPATYLVTIEYYSDLYCPGIAYYFWQRADTTLTVDLVLDSKENLRDKEITISPNPTSDFINIQSINKIDEIKLYNLNGKEFDVPKSENQLNMTSLNKGMYFLTIRFFDGQVFRTSVLRK